MLVKISKKTNSTFTAEMGDHKIYRIYLLLGFHHSEDSAIDLHSPHPHAQTLSCKGYSTHKFRFEVWLGTILTNPFQHCYDKNKREILV